MVFLLVVILCVIGWYINLRLYYTVLDFCDCAIFNLYNPEAAKDVTVILTMIPFASVLLLAAVVIFSIGCLFIYSWDEEDEDVY